MNSPQDKVVALDYNGDGKKDILAYRPGQGAAFLGWANGNGSFTNVVASATGIGAYDLRSSADKFVVFNYNNDGRDDLFMYRPGAGAA